MKILAAFAISLLIVSTPLLVVAQEAGPQPSTKGPSEPGRPDDRGSSGWTGGAREPNEEGTVGTAPRASDAEVDQQEYASGVDLNGPPVRFPANKTPE